MKQPTLQKSSPGSEPRTRRPYLAPIIQTWTDEQLLSEVGPAQGYMQRVDGSRSFKADLP